MSVVDPFLHEWDERFHALVAKNMILYPFFLGGIFYVFKNEKVDRILSSTMLVMVSMVYLFFSLIVKTKMPAFVYPVSSIVLILVGAGVTETLNFLIRALRYYKKSEAIIQLPRCMLLFIFCIIALKPMKIIHDRSWKNAERNAKINNTQVFKNLDKKITKQYVLFNCKSFEDVECMFYHNTNAYSWYPEKRILDSLSQKGYKIAAFKNVANQPLPEYFTNNKDILLLDTPMK